MNVSSMAVKYASALADVGAAAGAGDAVGRDLETILGLLSGHKELADALHNPAISFSAKRRIIEQLCSLYGFSKYSTNFVLVLLGNGRLRLLGEVAEAYQMVLDERAGMVAVEVFSARPLADSRRQQLEDVLKDVTASEIRCRFNVDEALLGGMKLQIGSKVFDGTVRTRLEEIRSAISGAR